MGAAGQQLGLRLFLEGLEVPVVSAQIQININAPATAAIQVVPGDKVLELKPRTMVHLFFWDYTLDTEPPPEVADPERVAEAYGITVDQATQYIAENPEQFANPAEEDLRGYKLLFSGEVIGVVMMKTPAGRQAVLQCSDFSTYWDTTYQFFVSYSPSGNFLGTSAAVWAGSDAMFDDLTAGHVSVMNEYLRSKPQTPGLQNVKGLMGGIISLLEAMGGVPRHTHGVNDFFTIAELKNHILQQIVAEQNDDTAQRLFDDKAFNDWLTRGMSSLGQLTTFRDMMKLLFQYVYYEVVPNPAPMYVPVKSSTQSTKKSTLNIKVELPVNLRTNLFSIRTTVELRVNQSFQDGPWDENNYAKRTKADIQRIANSPDMPHQYKAILEKSYTWLDKIVSTQNDVRALNTTVVPNSSSDPRAVADTLQAQEFLSGLPGGTRPAPPSAHYVNNRAYWGKTLNIIDEVLGKDIRYFSQQTKIVRSAAELDRLQTQIFRPDCFFAAAPRCNVVFPDQYTQFQFSRNFLQETTRLRLSVDWLFGADSGGLLAEYHFAPATDDIQKLAQKQGNSYLRALLPWEIYSGILPKFETIHEVNYVAGRAENRRGIKGNIKGAATNYAQRTANFNYIKYRFAARTAEISEKFNPFRVCGFPAVVIERPFILTPDEALAAQSSAISQNPKLAKDDMSEIVKAAAQQLGAPTQYLGMIAGLSHTVQQDGGSTSMTLTHCRTHRITDDDFLNILSTEIDKQVTTTTVSTVLNAEDLIRKGDWRLLKFLIDATPQNLDEQVQATNDAAADTDPDFELEDRPDGAPDISNVPAISQFGSLLTVPKQDQPVQVAVPSGKTDGKSRYVPITGNTKTDRLKGTRQTILVPDPGGKLGIGSKGPKGGKITQIQCFTDAAIAVIGKDINKSLSSKSHVTISGPKTVAKPPNPTAQKLVAGVVSVVSNSGALDALADVVPVITGGQTVNDFLVEPKTGKKKLNTNVVPNSKVFYMWKSIAIYETANVSTPVTKILPVEEGLRPPWFSPLYSNWFIGDEIYQPFIGCGSVVDQAIFATPSGVATFGTGSAQQQEMLDQLKAAGNDRQQVLQILANAKAKNIADVPDIESSVDVLAYIYGEVRRLNLDVHRFINDYTRRPIATMLDIFGSVDLAYTVNDQADTLTLVSGKPGFHSTAVADVGGRLRGLIDNPDLELSRLKSGAGKKAPVSRDLDPRPGRRAKVVEYLQEIGTSTGNLGIGVAG